MISNDDRKAITDELLQDIPDEKKPIAVAVVNLGFHLINLFERFVEAHEKIAAK